MTQLAVTMPVVTLTPPRPDPDLFPVLDPELLPSNIFWDVLATALTQRRDYGSATEAQYVAWLSRQLPVTMIDAAGNVHVDTRSTPDHRSMFTSHTDTVHSSGGVNTVRVDGKFWRASKGAALGADDGAGNAIMAYMIDRGVPGYYVFFRGEECGGIGSKWLSEEMPSLFKDIDRAIAFDRAGYYDVITHQAGGRCCSDDFADALSEQLSTETSWYVPCNGGVYTDTAEFVTIIPECTNLSVGYKNQHGDHEEQDVEFLWAMAQKMVTVMWDTLPTKRDPKAVEKHSRYGTHEYIDADWYKDYKANEIDDLDDDTALLDEPKIYKGIKLEDEDSSEYDAMLAIEEAMDGDYRCLFAMIAEVVYPEDPGLIEKRLRRNLLNDEALAYAMEMLDSGFHSEAVLMELFDIAHPN